MNDLLQSELTSDLQWVARLSLPSQHWRRERLLHLLQFFLHLLLPHHHLHQQFLQHFESSHLPKVDHLDLDFQQFFPLRLPLPENCLDYFVNLVAHVQGNPSTERLRAGSRINPLESLPSETAVQLDRRLEPKLVSNHPALLSKGCLAPWSA